MRGKSVLRLLAAIGLLAAVPLLAQEKTEIDRLRAEFEQLKKDVGRRMERNENDVQIHGFVSQGFMLSSDNNYLTDSDTGSFEFLEVGINFRANISDSLSVGAQFVGRDLGETGNNDVKIDWAYGDYNIAEWLGIRAGRVKIPVGMYNEERDVDAVRVPILLPQGVYPEIFREFINAVNGVSVYGSVPLKGIGSLNYTAYVGDADFDSEDNGLKRVQEQTGLRTVNDLEVDYVFGGGVMLETDIGLKVGASYFNMNDFHTKSEELRFGFGPPTLVTVYANNPRYTVTTYSLEYVLNKLTFSAEYQEHRGRSYSNDEGGAETRVGNHQLGYYGMLTYQLTDKVAVGAYYSMYHLDKKDKDGDRFAAVPPAAGGPLPRHLAYQRDVAIFTRIDLVPGWLAKIEYHRMTGMGQLLANENLDTQGNLQLTKDWNMLMLKLTYTF